MQIHELNTFSGSPTESDYLAVDNGTETTKLPMSNVGVAMTQAEAEAGTITAKRTIAPNIFKAAVLAITRAMAPYVVEQGTSGSWSYRKWSDGTAECWSGSLGSASLTFSAWGNQYYSDYSEASDYPITFTEVINAIITTYGSQGWVIGNYGRSNSNIGTIRFASNNNSGTKACYCNVYVFGKWR